MTDGGKGGESSDGPVLPPPNVDNIPRPLSPTKLTPVGRSTGEPFMEQLIAKKEGFVIPHFFFFFFFFTAHSQMRYQSDADLDVLRRRLSNAPRPLKKRSSITEPEGPQGPNIQKLLYQRLGDTLCGV